MPTTIVERLAGWTDRRCVSAAVGVLASLAVTSPAWSQVACGSRIEAGAQVVLAGDLSCAGNGDLVTVEGPAVLDLNGFTIRCSTPDARTIGVVLIGRGAIVRNGLVRDCATGVLAAGEGRHLVRDLTIVSPRETGIDVPTERNRVKDSLVFFPGRTGIDMRGAASVAIGNAVTGSAGTGILVRERATLERNVVSGSTGSGFQVAREGTVVRRNRAIGNQIGFSVIGDRNRFTDNEAESNGLGFRIDGSAEGNVIARNAIDGNDSDGVFVVGDGSKLRGNVVEDNAGYGIRLFNDVAGSVIAGNTVRFNGELDLSDDAPECGTNRWRNNTFGSSDQTCIR